MGMAPPPPGGPNVPRMLINGKPVNAASREELVQAVLELAGRHAQLLDLHKRKARLGAAEVADGLSFAIQEAEAGDQDAISELATFRTFVLKALETEWRPSPLFVPKRT